MLYIPKNIEVCASSRNFLSKGILEHNDNKARKEGKQTNFNQVVYSDYVKI